MARHRHRHRHIHFICLAFGSFQLIAWAGPSFAQQTSSAPKTIRQVPDQLAIVSPSGVPNADGAALSDIVVTAQRRAENLQNVPVAITAVSGAALANAGITGIESLQLAIPSLSFAQSAGYSLPRIRGVGTGAAGPGVENSVALYIDGVYIAATPAGMLAFNNIAQIAVLKGPQGTLFGRNATGGVIQITTLDPGRDVLLDESITYGNHATIGANLYASTPVTATVSADLAIYFNDQQNGFGHNTLIGGDVGGGRDISLRSKIKWQPTATTTIKLSGDYANTNADRPVSHVARDTLPSTGVPFTGNQFDTNLTFNPRQRIEQDGATMQIDQKIGELAVLSITAWRTGKLNERFDADAQPAPLTDVLLIQKDRQFSQELQLLSPKSSRFNWVLGGYYFDAKGSYDPQQTLVRAKPFLAPPTTILSISDQTTRSSAAFGQVTVALGGETNLTGGLRYTSERRAIAARRTVTLPNGVSLPPSTAAGRATFSKLTWRAALDHRFSDALLAYVSYNRGFKSGLFDPLTFPANLVQPEVLDAYEAGIKADLLDRRLRVNAAFFHYEYKNIQTARIENGVSLLLNGAGARIDGIDLDATVRATRRLTITVGLSVLDDHFTDFPNAIITTPFPSGGNSVTSGSAKGNRLPMTPNWTANTSVTYRLPTTFGEFEASGTYLHNDGYYEGPENRLKQSSFNIVDTSLAWTSRSGAVRVSIWGKNILNQFYATQLSAQNLRDVVVANDGRTYGATAGVKF